MKKGLCAAILAVMLCSLLAPAFAETDAFDADDSILRLVNKQHKITAKYKPELVKPNVPTNRKDQAEYIYMRPEAAEALEKMFAAAKKKGYNLLAVSGYRSYQTQKANYERKVKETGPSQSTVAPPGASEHQLGLAMDLVCESYRNLYTKYLLETEEFQWLYKNCYKYGFVVRYQTGWYRITGFSVEAWHFRYLGVAHAAALTWLNVPYETYVEKARELPDYVITDGNAYLLYGLMNSGLNLVDDGKAFNEMLEMPAKTKKQRQASIKAMTKKLLPEGVTLKYALSGKVKVK
ncbi:MAG: M15 family metallopeptidase [Clostridia bacterium]|nr:M15 family metallopeptidase [Clostridia bacterium]